jgi:hypothetical protein
VASERATLRDARNGRPKGVWRDAEAALDDARAAHSALRLEQAALDADVDRLHALEEEHAHAESAVPWASSTRLAEEARAQLAGIERARAARDALASRHAAVGQQAKLLLDQVHRDAEDAQRLADGRVELQAAGRAAEQAAAVLDAALRIRDTRLGQRRAVRAMHEAARDAAARRALRARTARLQHEVADIEASLARLRTLDETARDCQRRLAVPETLEADLIALRDLEIALAAADLRRKASATKLAYALPARHMLRVGQDTLHGQGEILLTEATGILLPDGGALTITPGGEELADASERAASLRARRQWLLGRVGTADLQEAEALWQRARQTRAEWALIQREMAMHAPQGRAALESALHEARVQWREALSRLAVDPVSGALDEAARQAPSGEPMADGAGTAAPACIETTDVHGDLEYKEAQGAPAPQPSDAAEADELARLVAELAALDAACDDAQANLARAQADAQARRATYAALQTRLQADTSAYEAAERVGARDTKQLALAEARDLHEALGRQLAQADAAIAAQRPETVRQDLERYEQSARLARERHAERHRQLLLLRGRLEQAGAAGLGERLAAAHALVQRAQRRVDEFARQAQALELLYTTLTEARNEALRRVQAPLTRRIDHYVGLLFPQARLACSESLAPGRIIRGDDTGDIVELSYGTQEQLGLLARLAYADLLKEAGKPTLLLLDDALVHTDGQRREKLKRALYDAGTRHQILIFTCHGEAWEDLGVEARALPGL